MKCVARAAAVWSALLFLVALTVTAGTVRWANTAGAGAWGAGVNWVGGNVPGTNDQAYFPNAATVVYPDLAGGSYGVTNLYLDNGGGGKYTYIYDTVGGGSLSLRGNVGLTAVGGSKNYFYGRLNVVRPSVTSTQAWDNAGVNDVRFLAPIGGTGTIWMASATAAGTTMIYSNTASASFRGNLVMDNSRNLNRGGVRFNIWWDHSAAGDAFFSFGRSADGSQPGTITMGSTISGYTGLGNSAWWPRMQFCPLITGANDWNAIFENPLVITGFGAQFSWAAKRATGASGNCLVVKLLNGVYINAPLFVSGDAVDQGPTGSNNQQPFQFAGGVTLYQQAPAQTHVAFWNRTSGNVYFMTPIVDGPGAYCNPLILEPYSGTTFVQSTNTYAWGTVIDQSKTLGGTSPGANNVYITTGRMGTGPMTILPGGVVRMDNTNAVAVGQTIEVQSSPIALGMAFGLDDHLAERISPASSGIFAFSGSSSASLKGLIGAMGPGLGNGSMFLSSASGDATFDGTSLKVGSGNVYRLSGSSMRGDQGGDRLILDNVANVGVLTGPNAVQIGSTQIMGGGPVWIRDPNDFTGKLTIASPWLNPLNTQLRAEAQNTTATPGASPIGSAAGELELIGGNYQTYQGAVTSHVAKAKVTVWSESMLDEEAGNRFTKFQTTDLVLTNRASLLVWFREPAQAQLYGRVVVLNEPAMFHGMVDPHIIASSNGTYHFAAYDTGADASGEKGFGLVGSSAGSIYTAGLPNPGTGVEIANVTADPAVANLRNVYAMRWGNFDVTGTGTITNKSGGMLWIAGNDRAFAPNLDFGSKEAVFYFSANNTLTVNGRITSSAGLTKSGQGTMVYTNLNGSLSGQLTVNRGNMDVIFDKPSPVLNGSLGNITSIYLNGGTLRMHNNPTTAATHNTLFATRTITLGPLGGQISRAGSENNMATYYACRITGPGCLYISHTTGNNWPVLQNANNDWAGGTQIANGDNVGTRVVQGAKIGKGPILVLWGTGLRLEGNDNLKWPGPPEVYLPLQITTQGRVHVATNSACMGSLSGAGMLLLGDASVNPAINCTVTQGLDNASSTWYGCIAESFNAAPRQSVGTVVKGGTGTWTVYGRQDYRGATVVTNGTLNLMGSVRGDGNVGPSGTLTGCGLVGGNLTLNGGAFTTRLSGSLRPLHVTGTLTINPGSRLDVSTVAGFNPGQTDFVAIQAGGVVSGINNLVVTSGYAARVSGTSLLISRPHGTLLEVR